MICEVMSILLLTFVLLCLIIPWSVFLLNYNVLSGDEEEEERCNCRDQEEQERWNTTEEEECTEYRGYYRYTPPSSHQVLQ